MTMSSIRFKFYHIIWQNLSFTFYWKRSLIVFHSFTCWDFLWTPFFPLFSKNGLEVDIGPLPSHLFIYIKEFLLALWIICFPWWKPAWQRCMRCQYDDHGTNTTIRNIGVDVIVDVHREMVISYIWKKKVKFEKVYMVLMKNICVYTQVLWENFTYIIQTMETRIPWVITMVISHWNWSINVYLIPSTNTYNITKGFT